MIQDAADKRSGFRFPAVVPVEYFKPDETAIVTYALNLCKNGTFISSDIPVHTGNNVALKLNIPLNGYSKIFKTKGTVVWERIQPFKSRENGMGVRFAEPLPEDILLNALADSTKKLIKESEAKRALEKKVEDLESELEKLKGSANLGRYVEKILFEVTNPILALSGRLETMKEKIAEYKKVLKGHDKINKIEYQKIIKDFEKCYDNIAKILDDYSVISDLVQIVGDDSETIKKRLLKRYGD